MRPTALALNLVVAILAAARFSASGEANWRLLAALAATSAPAAFIGGRIMLDPAIYRPLVGVVLLLAAARRLWQPERLAVRPTQASSLAVTLSAGAALGLLAGLTGTGGGIFLSPLIILLGWDDARRTAGTAAAFIVLNSAAGLLGNIAGVRSLPPELPLMASAVLIGALVGSWLGVGRLSRHRLLQALAIVLLIAALKLLLS